MRLSDAGLHQRRTKALYLNHRPTPWLTEDATRDRSNRLLDPADTLKRVMCMHDAIIVMQPHALVSRLNMRPQLLNSTNGTVRGYG